MPWEFSYVHLIELYLYGAAYFYPQAPEHVNRAAVLYIPSSSLQQILFNSVTV